jgi:rhodanese-related sulfurtransferase
MKIFSIIITVVVAAVLLFIAFEDAGVAWAKEGPAAEAARNYLAEIPEDNNMIAQDAFIGKILAGEELFVLDIRSAEDYVESHVNHAINAPWGKAISDNLDKLPADETIYVYCYSGQTSGQTVALLNIAGFDAKSVRFGWNFGISKVEGFDGAIESTVNEFKEVVSLDIDHGVKSAIIEYFEGLEDVSDSIYKNYIVSAEDARKLLDDDSVMFLSIRGAEDYAAGHIEGAVNIPWGKGMQENFNILPKNKTIIVYCYSGQTAGQTIAAMRLMGYDAVSISGGVGVEANSPLGWVNSGYELVPSEDAAPVQEGGGGCS